MKSFSIVFLAVSMLGGPAAFAESVGPYDAQSSVPELIALHEVIAPIWHKAYPARDTQALKNFVPQINELAEKLYKAKLPGILREKKAAWKDGVSGFRKSVKAYNAAAKGTDEEAMLSAAEELHRRYETLVRTIRPVLPEMEAFHKVLYAVYHKDLPAAQWDKIAGQAASLSAGAAAIAQARLPRRYEAKGVEFKGAADSLAKAAYDLEALGASAEGPAVKKAVLNVHARYLALQNLFE